MVDRAGVEHRSALPPQGSRFENRISGITFELHRRVNGTIRVSERQGGGEGGAGQIFVTFAIERHFVFSFCAAEFSAFAGVPRTGPSSGISVRARRMNGV